MSETNLQVVDLRVLATTLYERRLRSNHRLVLKRALNRPRLPEQTRPLLPTHSLLLPQPRHCPPPAPPLPSYRQRLGLPLLLAFYLQGSREHLAATREEL